MGTYMKSILKVLTIVFTLPAMASTVTLSPGEVITLEADMETTVACLSSQDYATKNYCVISGSLLDRGPFVYTLRIHHFNSNNVVRTLGQYRDEQSALDRMNEAKAYGWCL